MVEPSRRGKALVTMFNIAPWGGLHENIWYSCAGLQRLGWQVTVACRGGQLVDKLRAGGVEVHVVADWKDWAADAEVLSRRSWDVVHSHPFASRKLALAVAAATGAPLVSTFHGNNVDDLASWADRPHRLVAVSRAHAGMLGRVPGIDAARVVVVPNAVRDHLLDGPVLPWRDKVHEGEARVVVASRLDRDKRGLLQCVDSITEALRQRDDHDWAVQVLGGGGSREEMVRFLEAQAAKSPRLRVEFLGWVDSEQVPDLLRDAVLAVASGRGAAQSLAVGTPVVAFGSQGIYGLQTGGNLENGLWGNFGGYPLGRRPLTDITSDVAHLLDDPAAYAAAQAAGRDAVSRTLRQSTADTDLDEVYRQVAASARHPRRALREIGGRVRDRTARARTRLGRRSRR